MPFELLTSLLWVAVCVVLILGLAYWFTKYVAGRMGTGTLRTPGGGEKLQILAQLMLGKDQRLLLVRAGERYFLLGVTAAGISNLAEFSKEEADAWLAGADECETGQKLPNFREALQTVLKQKKQR